MRSVSPPVHPAEGGEFDVVDGAPGALSGASDGLGLEQRVHRFGQRVVMGVPDRADRRCGAGLVEALAVADAGELAAGVGVRNEALETRPACPAGHLQCVEHHLGAHVAGDSPADDAATEGVGDEAHVGDPRPGGHLVKSATHNRLGRSAVKSRSTRSAGRAAVGSATVVRTRLCRLAPRILSSFISRATWSRPMSWPARRAATHSLRAP